MVKLADTEKGKVCADGKIRKSLTEHDHDRLHIAIKQAKEVMEGAGVSVLLLGSSYWGHLVAQCP